MDEEVLRLHGKGLSNRQIAVSLGLSHHGKVGAVLDAHNLTPNGSHRIERLQINDGMGRCTKCKTWRPLEQFKIMRKNQQYAYRLTYCNPCQWSHRNLFLNANPEAYIRNRYNGSRQNAKGRGLDFSITLDQVKMLMELQRGLCAYTEVHMKMEVGNGLLDNTMSFDRWDTTKGYIPGNVLLCTKRFNGMKSNLTLEEFKTWMPILYKNGLRSIKMWAELGLNVVDVGDGIEF